MRRLLPLLLLCATLAGCTGTTGDDTTATTAAPPQDIAPTTAADDDGDQAFLDALAAIDPALAADGESALRDASNVCQELTSGKDEPIVIRNTALRYGVDEAAARRIVAAARASLCPTG